MTAAPHPEGFAEDGLPTSWSLSSRETYLQIAEAHPNLSPAALVVLFEACSLLALVDRMAAQVDVDGLMVEGSKSKIANPLLGEIRQSRVAALAALRSLGLVHGAGSAAAAGATLVGRRRDRRA